MFKLFIVATLATVVLGAADPKPGVVAAYGVAPVASYYTNVGTPASTVKTGHAYVAGAVSPLAYSASYPAYSGYGYSGYGYSGYASPYSYSSGYASPYAQYTYGSPIQSTYASPYGYSGLTARSYYY